MGMLQLWVECSEFPLTNWKFNIDFIIKLGV